MEQLRNWIMLGAGCGALMLVAFGGASAESLEGSVRGTTARDTTSSSSEKDYYWKVWNGALPERRGEEDLNDVLAVLTGKFTGSPVGCKFSYRGGGLSPSTIAARSGTRVRIENRDSFTHELSIDGLAGFKPLESGPGTARVVPVPAGGPWKVGDRIYGHVQGHLHSLRELVACASVTSRGRFRFENVPPGPYSLRILRGSKQVAVRRVTVPAGKALQIDPLTMGKSGRK